MPDDTEDFWEFDPQHDENGSLLHAVYLLDYFRRAGCKFTAYGVNLDIQEPAARQGMILTSEDLLEIDDCQPLIIELLKLEQQGAYNLQRCAGVPETEIEDLSHPDHA